MFKFLGHKLLNKKWLNACLLLGIVLLVAVASCNPMFKNGAMDMTLSSKFDAAIEDNNVYSEEEDPVIQRNIRTQMQ